ncbi:MAG: SRPBCC family protein [Acidimicrobiales bacterium]
MSRSGTFRLPVAPARAFPCFSPEGERAWAPGWKPEYMDPADGALRPGLVFRTNVGGEPTVWLLLRFDESSFEVEYVRLVPDSRVGLVHVRCAPAGAAETEVTVSYRLTALSEGGNRALERFSAEAFAGMMDEWRTAITAALSGSPRRA